jgi:hypothetical protein
VLHCIRGLKGMPMMDVGRCTHIHPENLYSNSRKESANAKMRRTDQNIICSLTKRMPAKGNERVQRTKRSSKRSTVVITKLIEYKD